ncbi:hypothetical protein B0T25DRAFT_576547 [Lasiosphaeria hispida]|uniref:Uncharacterized protein n=1 Tax=Lasiosphaeria hispida TaxID=260671 RepID=A0AAJ0HX47_9PEZI|nr:hypothetical protein B0T25DRAFT_576547 [Lasiosphaeria hispida]
MADQPWSRIISDKPIGKGLEAFRASFNSVCEDRMISCSPFTLGQLGQEARQTFPPPAREPPTNDSTQPPPPYEKMANRADLDLEAGRIID